MMDVLSPYTSTEDIDSLMDGLRDAMEVREGSEKDTVYREDFERFYTEVLSWKMPEYQRQSIPRLLNSQRLLFIGPPGHFKPLAEDSLVLMADGTHRLLGNIVPGDYIISGKGVPQKVLEVHEQGELPVLRIKTFADREIKAALDHPFLTPSGWVEASNLLAGQYLVVLKPSVNKLLTEHLGKCKFAGYSILTDQVVEIEDAGLEPCRCLNIENDHSFVANDFIVHNTTFLATYAAWRLGKNPALRIIVPTHTLAYSQLVVNLVCDICRSPRFVQIFGDLGIQTRGEPNFRFARRATLGRKDPTLLALGAGSSTPGYRTDLIFADDLVSQNNSRTPIQRSHLHAWFFGQLIHRRDPLPAQWDHSQPIPSQIILIGARMYSRDLYGELLGTPGWDVLSFTASKGKPLCPDAYPAHLLAEKEEQDYFTFCAQFLQKPQDFTVNFLDERWLHFYVEHPPTDHLLVYQGCDPNIAKDSSGGRSKFAHVTLGLDLLEKKAYFLDLVVLRKGSLAQKAEVITSQNTKWHPQMINLETNAAFALFGEYVLEQDFLPLNMSPSKLDKASKIAAMSTYFRNSQILLPGTLSRGGVTPEPWINPFIEDWRDFPHCSYDILDATEKAIEAAFVTRVEPASGRTEPRPDDSLRSRLYGIQSPLRDINVFH